MAPVIPSLKRIRAFADEGAFERWLRAHHDTAPEIWIKVFKKASGVRSITTAQALDVALCWGWIDGLRKSFDDKAFLQRYSPRRPKSVWSQINRNNIARLIKAGRMTPHGLRQVDAAKADGRWQHAYAPIRSASVSSVPADLKRAIARNPRALKTFKTLGRMNLFALAFRTNNMKTPEGRARKIGALVDMLARGKTIVPESAASGRVPDKRRFAVSRGRRRNNSA
jgi:uncharacterized protein YdeI (YjbR/CyaY-like superfamily)